MLTFKVHLFPVRTFTAILDSYQDSAFNSYITDPPLCFPSVVLFWLQTASPQNIQMHRISLSVSSVTTVISRRTQAHRTDVQYVIWCHFVLQLSCVCVCVCVWAAGWANCANRKWQPEGVRYNDPTQTITLGLDKRK